LASLQRDPVLRKGAHHTGRVAIRQSVLGLFFWVEPICLLLGVAGDCSLFECIEAVRSPARQHCIPMRRDCARIQDPVRKRKKLSVGPRYEAQHSIAYEHLFAGPRASAQPTQNSCMVSAAAKSPCISGRKLAVSASPAR